MYDFYLKRDLSREQEAWVKLKCLTGSSCFFSLKIYEEAKCSKKEEFKFGFCKMC